MSAFDPNSESAVLSRILTQLETLSNDVKDLREEFRARVSAIETEQATNRGKLIGVTAVVSAFSGFIAWLGTLWATKH